MENITEILSFSISDLALLIGVLCNLKYASLGGSKP